MSADIASVEIERLRKRVEELEFWLSTLIRALGQDPCLGEANPKRKKARRTRTR